MQRCIIHLIRYLLKYVTWRDRKAFIADLKTVYQAATREEAEANLIKLEEAWGDRYGAAVRSTTGRSWLPSSSSLRKSDA